MRVDEFIPDNVKNVLQTGQSSQVNLNGSDANSENNNVDFAQVLEDKLSSVNDKQVSAQEISKQFVEGDDVDVHQVMLSTEEAQLSLELAIQVRNKLVDSYQELSKMQL
ncbi:MULTISPECIES: flagellar hook-basal body complex protein FliE [Clostridium]|uniref:flagellar hook-basal body complex protein FliE n=1 Tax=Clostridium TaxID=1485 RepID=UPI00069EA75A|nr:MULTISPECIES: flagellar hook-basal body complex protein FliE [Clostridium]KOF55866.1 flagellar hook-basal body protein FliE [Clostridium sp. DMHC 10]MCD2345235.1 flagellar hook-basal body complex protein FliE [Clostridium guangxiense]